MAVELFSDNSSITPSPRISFSHDLCLSDIVPVEPRPFRSNSSGSVDFDFCVRKSFDQESSSADELFSDGKILPTEIKKKPPPAKQQLDVSTPPHQVLRSNDSSNTNTDSSGKETKTNSDDSEDMSKQSSKSFWRFKRSSSLNCGSGYGRSFCPLPLLSRSNSTGSTDSTPGKRSTLSSKESHNSKQQKQSFLKGSSQLPSCPTPSNYQKPPLKKNYGSYGNGVPHVPPVLNVPTGNLFGLGSIFFNGKEKNKKK